MGRKSKAKIRRQEILSHFYEVIIEEGFEGASIGKIAKRMEVNPSLLIHYFSTKDAMVIGLIDYIMSTYSSHIIPDFSSVEDPQERWDDVVDVVSKIQWDLIMNKTVFYSFYALGMRNPEIRMRFVDFYEGLRKTLAKEIAHAKSQKIIEIEDPEESAKMIISLIEGTNFYQHVTSEKSNRVERSDMFKAVMRQLFPPFK
ncbi:MAG: TetR family transcriptional regulator [Bacteroidetes bacterium]|nr:TetR family transcriptional regulator [Bacteroidota bacterium]